jgi:hypothetical protein
LRTAGIKVNLQSTISLDAAAQHSFPEEACEVQQWWMKKG